MSLDIKVMPLGPISANCYILTDKKSRESAVIDPGDFNEALPRPCHGPTAGRTAGAKVDGR